jgi:ankyrin repeat protein
MSIKDRINRKMLEAAKDNNLIIMKTCLKLGADINAQDKSGNTALHLTKKTKIVNFLIEEKADMDIKNIYDCTPLISNLMHKNNGFSSKNAKFGKKMDKRDIKEAKKRIAKLKPEIYVENAKSLIKAGCSLEGENRAGDTVMHLWAENSNKHDNEDFCTDAILSKADSLEKKNLCDRTPLEAFSIGEKTQKRMKAKQAAKAKLKAFQINKSSSR